MTPVQADLPETRKARVEIIPLIDVIFFLLATFVLFTLTLHRLRVIDATLPAGTRDAPITDTTCFIQTTADGGIFWKVGAEPAEAISVAELAIRLADYRRRVAFPRVMLRSDAHARLGAAVAVLDEVRRARIRDVAIETHATPAGS